MVAVVSGDKDMAIRDDDFGAISLRKGAIAEDGVWPTFELLAADLE